MLQRDVRSVPKKLAALCLALALLHGYAAIQTRHVYAAPFVMSPPPGDLARRAMAFGDDQFLYRSLALQLQNAGDGGGRITRMGDYNFDYVVGWLQGLQSLDAKSNHHFLLAARYFSFTTSKDDLRKLVDFLADNAVRDPQRHWFWLAQAIELADHKVGDVPRALELSLILATFDFPGIESWVWLFPALLYEKLGRYDEGLKFLENAAATKDARLTAPEKNWIQEVTQRLKAQTG